MRKAIDNKPKTRNLRNFFNIVISPLTPLPLRQGCFLLKIKIS
jgi:hypothetical protein